jgi:hypothetical protein
MTTTQIEWPTRVGLSLQAYVRTWADETELGLTEDETEKITSELVDFVNRVLTWRLSGQVRVTASGPILADTDAPADEVIRIVAETIEGFDLFGLVDPDA